MKNAEITEIKPGRYSWGEDRIKACFPDVYNIFESKGHPAVYTVDYKILVDVFGDGNMRVASKKESHTALFETFYKPNAYNYWEFPKIYFSIN